MSEYDFTSFHCDSMALTAWTERPDSSRLGQLMSHQTPGTLKAAAKGSLCLGALGVVFGDIGTSPLYTMQTCIQHLPGGDPRAGVLGVLSLIFWTLILVVSVKYLGFVMRADNQ